MSATPATTLLPGVKPHGSGFRARMSFAGRREVRTFATAEEANRAILDWRELRAAGLDPDLARERDMTLGEATDRWLERQQRRDLAPQTVKGLTAATLPWRTGKLSRLPLRFLTYRTVLDAHEARAYGGHFASADRELRALKAVLTEARQHGAELDDRLLTLKAVKHQPRERRSLTAAELVFLARHAIPEARRMLLVYGTTGMRFGELASLTDDRVNLDEGWIFVPAALCKERRDKWIDLTPAETELLREQLDPSKLRSVTGSPTSRLPGRALTPNGLVFTSMTGKAISHATWTRYFQAACDAAADAWRKIHDVDATPFDDLTPHDLRSTAATLMRDAGLAKEDAAARLGHADTDMLDRIYDRGDRRARARKALRMIVRDSLLTDPAAVTTPDDAAGSASGV